MYEFCKSKYIFSHTKHFICFFFHSEHEKPQNVNFGQRIRKNDEKQNRRLRPENMT